MRAPYFYIYIVALLCAGCAYLPPMEVICKGKGVLSVQGGPYAGNIQGDCGEGFTYQRRPLKD